MAFRWSYLLIKVVVSHCLPAMPKADESADRVFDVILLIINSLRFYFYQFQMRLSIKQMATMPQQAGNDFQ
jgi:hypothetical protein